MIPLWLFDLACVMVLTGALLILTGYLGWKRENAGRGFRSELTRARDPELVGGLTAAGEGRNVGGSMNEGAQTRSYPMPDAEQVREASPAELELAELHEAIDAYSSWIDTLEHQLRNALRPDQPHEVTDSKSELVMPLDRSSLTSSIDQCGGAVQSLNRRLQRLIDRIDV